MPFSHVLGTRSARVGVTLAVLAFLFGCENSDHLQGGHPQPQWLATAIVADLTHSLAARPAEATLAEVGAIGFDTVLLDARSTPPALLRQWLEEAKRQQMRTVAWITSPAGASLNTTGEILTEQSSLLRADGLLLTLERPADLDYARNLRAVLQDAGSRASLIAHVAVGGSLGMQQPGTTLPTGVFDATFKDNASEDRTSVSESGEVSQPPMLSQRYLRDDTHAALTNGLARWHRIAHCDTSSDRYCSEDIRPLVMGFMQAPVPVTGILEESYWKDVYTSLIQIRRENPLIRNGAMEWYATDDEAGVLAYRITNERRQHILVAVNVSDNHLELPLPFGFMAVSKIRLWASYDPTVRELVTSKPVALPARSAVVVIDD